MFQALSRIVKCIACSLRLCSARLVGGCSNSLQAKEALTCVMSRRALSTNESKPLFMEDGMTLVETTEHAQEPNMKRRDDCSEVKGSEAGPSG